MGEEVINTLVTHDRPWSTIYAEGNEHTRTWMDRQRRKFKWSDKWEFPHGSPVMTAREVADTMRQWGMDQPDARIIEYSRGNRDTSILNSFLSENGGYESAIGGHKGHGLLAIWERKLPGFWWCSQDNIFMLAHPTHELARKSHRAMVDAQKLRILFLDVVADSAD